MPVIDIIQQNSIDNYIITVSCLITSNIQCDINKVNYKQPIRGLLFWLLNIAAWFKLLPKEKNNKLVKN